MTKCGVARWLVSLATRETQPNLTSTCMRKVGPMGNHQSVAFQFDLEGASSFEMTLWTLEKTGETSNQLAKTNDTRI